jgi:hypothetical protein
MQNCAFRWSHPPPQQDYDHRYNWSPYPTDPISNLPPWAPPVYYPVPSTPRGAGYQCGRQPPTLFDSVDFPPPYTSREPSIAGRRTSQGSIGMEYALDHHRISWDRLGPSVFRFFRQGTARTVSEDSFDYIDRTVRVLGSSSGTSEGVFHHDDTHGQVVFRRALAENIEDETLRQSQGAVSHVREMLPSSSTESDSETPHDNVFTIRETCTITSDGYHGDTHLASADEQAVARRHSWTPQIRATRSSNVYSAHDEIYHAHIAPNVNPWARSMSENEAHGNDRNTSLPVAKQRSNSTPCYTAYHVTRECSNGNNVTHTTEDHGRVSPEITEASEVDNPTPSAACPHESLFRHFTESGKSTRSRPRKKRRRPRHNPGHILEHDSSGCKDVTTQASSAIDIESACTEYRETTL